MLLAGPAAMQLATSAGWRLHMYIFRCTLYRGD